MMNKKPLLISLVLLMAFVVSFVSMPVQAQTGLDDLGLSEKDGVLIWTTDWQVETTVLKISFPDETVKEYRFKDGKAVQLDTAKFEDGLYGFELIAEPDVEFVPVEGVSTDGREQVIVGVAEDAFTTWQGDFIIINGVVGLSPLDTGSDQDVADSKAQVFATDLITQGSNCTGMDCNPSESFGFDTFRLKENNLRIHFQDTSSSASFPTTDWRITINDSSNGGGSYFAIDDVDAGRRPFTVEANANQYSLYIDGDRGDPMIGVGTNAPAVNLHIAEGNTPTVRLDQDGTEGWTKQIWDIAGHEGIFFIRDVTHGSKLPFLISTDAPTNSLYIAKDGDIGLGTKSPQAKLHVAGGDVFIDGDLVLEGFISERSDVAAKENFSMVSGKEVLAKVIELPITEWNYIDNPDTQHIGPMAQDFYAAFGLGTDDKHIAALDVNGVTLVSIQELNRLMVEKESEISVMQAEMDALADRVNQLERGSANTDNGLNMVLPAAFGLVGMLLGALLISKRK